MSDYDDDDDNELSPGEEGFLRGYKAAGKKRQKLMPQVTELDNEFEDEQLEEE